MLCRTSVNGKTSGVSHIRKKLTSTSQVQILFAAILDFVIPRQAASGNEDAYVMDAGYSDLSRFLIAAVY